MRKLNSFDIFDTLIARRCVDPHEIFVNVEKISGTNGFLEIRRKAEINVAGNSYTLDDIYSEMVKAFGYSKEQADQLKEIEIRQEIHNVIPIKENIEKVKDGDLLITDMYLPRFVIEAMLKKAGLSKQVGLIVSSHGKQSNDIWPKLKKVVSINTHLGDNLRSDVENPLVHQIFGVHVKNHSKTDAEVFFEKNGLRELSRVIRETRLKLISDSLSNQEKIQALLQINFNVPMLIMACFHLYKSTRHHKIDNFLFSSRDCHLMERVFCKFGKQLNWQVNSHYFLTSRVARLNSSKSYLEYFKSLCNGSTAVVDICGTGWSLSNLYHEADLNPLTYLVHSIRNKEVLEKYDAIRSVKKINTTVTFTNDQSISNNLLEWANYNSHGMFMDMKEIDGYDSTIPEFEDPEYPTAVRKSIENMENAQHCFLQSLDNYNLECIAEELENQKQNLNSIFLTLYKSMGNCTGCLVDIIDYHAKQENKTSWHLEK